MSAAQDLAALREEVVALKKENEDLAEQVRQGSGHANANGVEWPFDSGGSWTSTPPEVSGIIQALHEGYRQGGSWQRRIKSGVEEYDVDLRAMIQTNMYGTPMASQNMERRGVGLNRSIHALLQNCQLQQCADVKKRNQICLQEKLYSELYTSPTSRT